MAPRAPTTQHQQRTLHSNVKPDTTKSSDTKQNGTSNGVLDKERRLQLARNIDMIVFGDIAFRSWYPSWYPKEIIGEQALIGESKGIVVDRLNICPKCFAYSKEMVMWLQHVKCCERSGREVPGNLIYTHPAGKGKGIKPVWSVWEVDGEVDTLFCQRLSLFAKLFLDNKSVFFDVSGFNYFLLVHTNPVSGIQQIVGFFSKEKMSWDNNNLACILIFPPWQKKGLGSILMGVSYEISRREGIMGGPEKPISDLGKKGYKRYWSAEIARWILEAKETDRKKGKGMPNVEQISQETWIAPEDCLCVLRDMSGVVVPAGAGKGAEGRVKVDKVALRAWVQQQRLSLERVVDPNGFVEGYGYKDPDHEEIAD
ncbi:acyl-CoA N-acyltransferase [Xylogone sp. PMI_703]|nr:acyl-CoA N-acyltransferase [Xylogone sp. PMI_703]